jgi:anhydro-N-acetylmuramic acid kinase
MTSSFYIGLMSGTSADGIDAALLEFSKSQFHIRGNASINLPDSIREAINKLCNNGTDELNTAAQLGIVLSNLNASLVNSLLSDLALFPEQISAIGYHGQTIRHLPGAEHPYSIQIGCPSTLAFKTKITTITDFRMADICAGGQGAPLVPAFHEFAFKKKNTNRVVVNLGGIANLTFLPGNPEQPVIGFDTGPGNTLLDAWIKQHKAVNFDNNGSWAKNGTLIPELLDSMMADSYVHKPTPKSTGKEHFNLKWLNILLANYAHLSPEDVQRTLLEFTSHSIAIHIKAIIQEHSAKDCEIYLCGGGIKNTQLIQSLQDQLPEITLQSTAELGIDPQLVECAAFAWLARQTINKLPGNLPAVTGASEKRILGGIYLS